MKKKDSQGTVLLGLLSQAFLCLSFIPERAMQGVAVQNPFQARDSS